jgi:hypothetical protein
VVILKVLGIVNAHFIEIINLNLLICIFKYISFNEVGQAKVVLLYAVFVYLPSIERESDFNNIEFACLSYPFLFTFLILHKVEIALSFVIIIFVQTLHTLLFFKGTWVHILGSFFSFKFLVKILRCRRLIKFRLWRWYWRFCKGHSFNENVESMQIIKKKLVN